MSYCTLLYFCKAETADMIRDSHLEVYASSETEESFTTGSSLASFSFIPFWVWGRNIVNSTISHLGTLSKSPSEQSTQLMLATAVEVCFQLKDYTFKFSVVLTKTK